MMIPWKGKGILIFLYFMATGIVLGLFANLLISKFGVDISFEVAIGAILIATGIWTKLTAEDYYIDKNGRKVSLEIENSLFFIKMRIWGLILPLIGIGVVVWGIMNTYY